QDFTPLFGICGRRVSDCFDPKKEERFVEAIFGISGKWKAVTRDRESYGRHVRKVFEEQVFSVQKFEPVLEQIRSDYAYATAAAQNRLMVALYEDIRPARPGLRFEKFRSDYGLLAGSLAPQVLRDLGMNLVSFAGSDAAAVLFVAALSSAGILGTSVAAGTAWGPMTFGISLAVGVVAGIALDALVGDAYEDAARMEVRRHVNELRNRVIDDVHDALVRALLAYRTLQERCVVALYEGGSDERLAGRP
ncbi:MAG: hypothetical protein HY293_13900, partial [Planctomycetes bacterium]|nr:hypothetical protein [Planctomycetota bacterium]